LISESSLPELLIQNKTPSLEQTNPNTALLVTKSLKFLCGQESFYTRILGYCENIFADDFS